MNKNQKGFTVIEGVIILVVVLLIGGITWLVVGHRKPQPLTVDDLLTTISKDAENTYANVSFERHDTWGAEASATAFNEVPGYDYSVSGVGRGIWYTIDGEDKSKTVTKYKFFHKIIPAAANINEVQAWVGKQLVKYGYTTTDNKTYGKGSTTCTDIFDPPALSGSDLNETSNLLQVTCSGSDVLKGAAAQMKPFVDAYVVAHPGVKASDLAVGPLTVKSQNGSGVIGSSHATGYDIAEMVVSTKSKKTIALYYSKNADIFKGANSGWQYVTQANDEFGFKCGDMAANPDSRKAFYDQVCLSAHGQVKLGTNNRALQ